MCPHTSPLGSPPRPALHMAGLWVLVWTAGGWCPHLAWGLCAQTSPLCSTRMTRDPEAPVRWQERPGSSGLHSLGPGVPSPAASDRPSLPARLYPDTAVLWLGECQAVTVLFLPNMSASQVLGFCLIIQHPQRISFQTHCVFVHAINLLKEEKGSPLAPQSPKTVGNRILPFPLQLQ